MSTQILESIPDIRLTRAFSIVDASGITRDVEIHEYATADDFMRHGVRAVIAEKTRGEPYESIMNYQAITSLIQTRVPVVRS
jgi:hypothetical protein